MKREFLKGLELEKDVIDKIMDENGKDIEAAKAGLEDLKKENESLKTQIAERDTQLEELKNSSEDIDGLKKQIADLQADNKAKDEAHNAEMTQLKVESAISAALAEAKAKNPVAVKALLKDLDKATFDENGKIRGLSEQISALKKSDEYLFESSTPKPKGATPGAGSDQSGKVLTREEFNRMSYKDRVALYDSDPETYKQLTE